MVETENCPSATTATTATTAKVLVAASIATSSTLGNNIPGPVPLIAADDDHAAAAAFRGSGFRRCSISSTASTQDHLVVGQEVAQQVENALRVLSHVAPCFPGTLHMSQNPFLRWPIMIAQPQPLIEVFAAIPDFRCGRGKRHPLPAILSLACCAMLCGYRSYSAIAEWGRNYGTRIAQALGFTHNTPCAATLHTVFRHVDRDVVEATLGAWAEGVVVSTPHTHQAKQI
jgi:hypothetical protein